MNLLKINNNYIFFLYLFSSSFYIIENALLKSEIKEYCEKSIKKCSNCWAIRLCSMCYAGRYNDDGFENIGNCDGTRREIEKNLIFYHQLLESNPEKMDFLRDTYLV